MWNLWPLMPLESRNKRSALLGLLESKKSTILIGTSIKVQSIFIFINSFRMLTQIFLKQR